MARKLIVRRVEKGKLPQMRGIMAEAIFLDQNPEWGYVKKPNASQHDVYRWLPGRQTPFNGQVKVHADGSPKKYAADMDADHLAHRFFVPDDHVESVKTHLREQAQSLEASGQQGQARRTWRNYGRVRGIGASFSQIDSATRNAYTQVVSEGAAKYVTFGASLALAAGPVAWGWAFGELHANQAAYRLTRVGSILGVGIGTDALLGALRRGALRGSLRGNAVVAVAVTITEVTWQLYERGWREALREPEFYEMVVGGVSAAAAGLTVGGAVALATSEFGLWVSGPAGFLGATAAGTLAYFGGRHATHLILEVFSLDMLKQYAINQTNSAREGIDARMLLATIWPPSS